MAALTWYATSSLVSVHQEMSETDPGTEAFASPVTGWVVSTGSTNHAAFDSQTEVAASAFVDANPPDGSIDTTNGDCLRSTNTYTGDFASANWNVHFAARANTRGGTQDGRMRCRLFRSANADGSSATEITSAQQQGGLVSNLTTSATQVSTATFNPGAFSVSGEYIFIQLAWERTGAGDMTTADVNMRIGNASSAGTRVISSDFTASSPTGDATGAMSPFAGSANGALEFSGSATGALSIFAGAANALLEFIGSATGAMQSFAGSATATHTDPPISGSATGALARFAADALATVINPITGTVSGALASFAAAATATFTVAGGAPYAKLPNQLGQNWPAAGQYQSISAGTPWPAHTQYDELPDD